MEAIPRRATSDEVSKPRPKRIPKGYIFQGLRVLVISTTIAMGRASRKKSEERAYLSMSLNIFLKTKKRQPAP